MKKWSFFKKYVISKVAIVLSIILMATLAVLFVVMGENVAKLEAEFSQASEEQRTVLAEKLAVAEMRKEYTLIFYLYSGALLFRHF